MTLCIATGALCFGVVFFLLLANQTLGVAIHHYLFDTPSSRLVTRFSKHTQQRLPRRYKWYVWHPDKLPRFECIRQYLRMRSLAVSGQGINTSRLLLLKNAGNLTMQVKKNCWSIPKCRRFFLCKSPQYCSYLADSYNKPPKQSNPLHYINRIS